MARIFSRIGVALAALALFAQPASALVTAPTYLDPAGRPAAAIGIVCINPDLSSCTFGGSGSLAANASATPTAITAGSGKSLNVGLWSDLFTTLTDGAGNIISPMPKTGGQVAVTAAANSYATGFSPDLGKIGDSACTTDNGAACDLMQLLMRTNQRITSMIAAIGTQNANGQATKANSQPTVPASDYISQDGALCATSDPTENSAATLTGALQDCLGKKVVIPALRLQKAKQFTTITSSASETTIITAGAAGVFNDPFRLLISNTSASTDGTCTIKEATSGSTVWVFAIKAGATGGFSGDVGSATPQSTAANNWTATCTSLASWNITAEFLKTKG